MPDLKYEIISTKYETTILNESEAESLVVAARESRYAIDGGAYLNSFQTYMAIIEGSRIIGGASIFFGQFLREIKNIARNDYDFANEVYFQFTAYGYDAAKIRIKFEQVKVIDTGDSGNENTVVCTFWRTAGRYELVALHAGSGWDIIG